MLTEFLNYTPGWVSSLVTTLLTLQVVTATVALNYFLKAKQAAEHNRKLELALSGSRESLRSMASMAQTVMNNQRRYMLIAREHSDVRQWLLENADTPITHAPMDILIKLMTAPIPEGPPTPYTH